VAAVLVLLLLGIGEVEPNSIVGREVLREVGTDSSSYKSLQEALVTRLKEVTTP